MTPTDRNSGLSLPPPLPGLLRRKSEVGQPASSALRRIEAVMAGGLPLDINAGLHLMTVSLAPGGERLGAMFGEDADYLQGAGSRWVETHQFTQVILNNGYVVRKSAD